jgi:hypothetical protein
LFRKAGPYSDLGLTIQQHIESIPGWMDALLAIRPTEFEWYIIEKVMRRFTIPFVFCVYKD